MPRKKQGIVHAKRVKPTADNLQPASNNNSLKCKIIDSNDKGVEENGLDRGKSLRDGDTNRYLHKKFKKIATLEDSPRAKGILYPVPTEDIPLETKPASPPPGAGRYVCPYCKMSCAKPSVLQKHIRAHTNERPYPCLPCGFAFKTKSNLYKHCRSRAHSLKMDGQSSEEEEAPSSEGGNSSPPEVKKIYKPKFHLSDTSQSSSPSPEFLNMHINKLISDNQAIVDESIWPKEGPYRNGESRLALALRSATPELDDLQPLNLTVKEPRKRSISETLYNREPYIKDLLFMTAKQPEVTRTTEEMLHPCPYCKVVFRTSENLEMHLYSCKPKTSPGPLLGKTPLVESFKEVKKRKVDIGLRDEHKTKVRLFGGGEVQVLDGNEKIALSKERKEIFTDHSVKKEVLTIAKPGLHSFGGTMIHSEPVSPKPFTEKMVLPINPVAPPSLNVPGISTPVQLRFPPSLNPLTSITAFNPLTLPPATSSTIKSSPSPYNGGVVNILHGGKAIPFVPGMPGPNSLLANQPLIPKKPEKGVIMKTATSPKVEVTRTLTIVRHDSEEKPSKKENDIIKPTIKELAPSAITVTSSSDLGDQLKFVRPNSLPLKPGTYTPKRPLPFAAQHTASLVSPETPRPRKAYSQLYLNGHAYTYLGLKCSSRMFFCTLNKPQPIYVPLSPDQYKVSMYSNWTICPDASPTPPGLDSRKAMSYYDSRNRHSSYTLANRNKQDIITHSTYHTNKNLNNNDLETNLKSDGSDANPRRIKVCEGGFESNEDYIYVRGRGRGRYVCEECGIRCKKPSMLKKHIRTHTDLRPYTCKHCAFSFKTKGNLTKHMKSKAHYKKCVELDIKPVPTSIEDSSPEDEGSGRQDGNLSGTNGEDSDDDSEMEEDDDEEDDEDDSEEEGDECKMEREAAKSLLTLSEVTLETAHRQYVSAGLVPPVSFRPKTYPYTIPLVQQNEKSSLENITKLDTWRSDVAALSKRVKDLTALKRKSESSLCSTASESARPMDLSSKTSSVTSVITSVGDQALLMATICSTTERLPTTPTPGYVEDGQLLHAYLTERAVLDSRIKLHQVNDKKKEPSPGVVSVSSAVSVVVGASLESGSLVSTEAVHVPLKTGPQIVVPPPPPPLPPPVVLPPVTVSLTETSATAASPASPVRSRLKAEFMPPSSAPALTYISSTEDGRSMCGVCNKVFSKPSQLRLHVNIHYFERPFRCESCAVSFRTKGHLQKHQRSLSHLNKVNMNTTFGTATSSNPRPFKCDDCKIAFRIHGHLAKHFRSKMHIMKLECLGKLPFGTYAELERSGINMNDIDTTDCENSLESLQILAQKLYEKDPSKLGDWEPLDNLGRPTAVISGGTTAGGTLSDHSSGGGGSDDELLVGGGSKEPPHFHTTIDKYTSGHHADDGVR
ncbi:zinc finger protein schnurri isoform X4 [Rhodnius prolixus]|uniref:zinc finger protein schnurri isoform X4 n=1 Tax=Rhodnius prolixus TaxID=13249 RepID=UPI003D18C15C